MHTIRVVCSTSVDRCSARIRSCVSRQGIGHIRVAVGGNQIHSIQVHIAIEHHVPATEDALADGHPTGGEGEGVHSGGVVELDAGGGLAHEGVGGRGAHTAGGVPDGAVVVCPDVATVRSGGAG